MNVSRVFRDDHAPPAEDQRSVAARATDAAFRQGDAEASQAACLVAEAHGVTVQELFHHSRSRAPIAATRQLAMYLMHVALGRSLTDVGTFYGRDRTTVSHACGLVEDQRDLPEFDAEVGDLERRIRELTPCTTELLPPGADNDC